MVPSRITAVSAKKQRELALAIKRARFMAILTPAKKEDSPRREYQGGRGEFRAEGRDGGGPREGGFGRPERSFDGERS